MNGIVYETRSELAAALRQLKPEALRIRPAADASYDFVAEALRALGLMTAKNGRLSMSNPDLFPLLFNRLSHENQDIPQFIGEFDGVGALPKGDYPAIYCWFDRERSCVRLSFNTPMLSDWCIEEAHRAGIDVDANDAAVLEAMDKLREASTSAFQNTLTSMSPRSEGLKGAEAAVETQYQERPSKKRPWWRLW